MEEVDYERKTKLTGLWSILLALVIVVGVPPIASLAENIPSPKMALQHRKASTEFTIQEQATDSNTQSSQTDGNSRTGLWTTLHITNQNYEAAEESYAAALEIFEMM